MTESNETPNTVEEGDESKHRRIKSFVMRAGRMTEGQQRGLDQGGPLLILPLADSTVDYDQVVDRLETLLASRHFHLLEHLSQAVLDTLGDSFPVKRAEVTLAKPLAVPKARRVSVTRKPEWRREAVKAVPLAL